MELDVPDSLLDELGPTGNGSGDLLPEGLNGVWSKLISKNFLVKKMIQVGTDPPPPPPLFFLLFFADLSANPFFCFVFLAFVDR